ncbi:MAG: ABC transporter permease, partial [Clostridia bacterium]|nr:ABC transporter permease [Clostridia bacterium]
MNYKSLTSTDLALKNLKRKPLRTAGLIIIVGLLSFVLFGGSILSVNLKNGLNSTKSRFGADLMIVPLEAEADAEGILIKGEPNYFYFDKSLATEIATIQGIESSSLQFYLTSSNQGCCDVPVQFIGFDPDTDFTVQPWIEKVYNGKVNDGALIVGSDINVENGSTLQFFDREYPVAAKLEETGTGLDQAVFANMNTLKDLFLAAKEKGLSFTENVAPETSVSSVMVKIKAGYDADEVIHNIRVKTDGLQIVKTKSMLSGIAETLGAFIWFIYILAAMLLLLALIVLSVIFSITVNERKKEFSIIRALGGTKRFVLAVIFKESLGISISGGIAGVLTAAIVLF